MSFSAAAAAKSLQSCLTLWLHRQQPTRLPRPWDSPGKNTGVGCHFLLQCMKVKSESEVSQMCPTLSDPMDHSLSGSSIHGIFQARVLEWGAIAFSGWAFLVPGILPQVSWLLLSWLATLEPREGHGGWSQDLRKLRFSMPHHRENWVRNKVIGKKWTYLKRNIPQAECGPSQKARVAAFPVSVFVLRINTQEWNGWIVW